MYNSDYNDFKALMESLAAAFDRTLTDARLKTFWEALKDVPFPGLKSAVAGHIKNGKRFPFPNDLRPAKSFAPRVPVDDGPPMSSWAVAANKIMFALAYLDKKRGFVALGPALLEALLATKREYVRMAEESAASGELWDTQEFNVMCREGFQKILGGT